MKIKSTVTFILLFVIMSCKQEVKPSLVKKKEKQDNQIAKPKIEKVKDSLVITYFPQKKDTFKLDTLLLQDKVRVILSESYIPKSYVINSFEVEKGLRYEHRYRDSKIDVKVFKEGDKLVDTTFIKSSFLNENNKEIINVGNLQGYNIEAVNNETLDFFGSICKPDTDWCYDFYHIYDLKERKFITKEYIDPEGG
ncbi:DUF4738 domain-containing protein [Tenacibaculum sp. 190524A05c]|uniref:Lipoprotein n=1 Tax=Tenacibaculum platacis TaxID=3137852 RepID=A0ABP1EQW7_9FLAO